MVLGLRRGMTLHMQPGISPGSKSPESDARRVVVVAAAARGASTLSPAFSKSEGPTHRMRATAVFINTLGVSVSVSLRFPSEREERRGLKRDVNGEEAVDALACESSRGRESTIAVKGRG